MLHQVGALAVALVAQRGAVLLVVGQTADEGAELAHEEVHVQPQEAEGAGKAGVQATGIVDAVCVGQRCHLSNEPEILVESAPVRS